jgi:hypothetical protein
MKFLFDDDSFSFDMLRTAGFALHGKAHLGEVLVTTAAITGRNQASDIRRGRPPRSGWRKSANWRSPPDIAPPPGKPCCGHRTTTAPQMRCHRETTARPEQGNGPRGHRRWTRHRRDPPDDVNCLLVDLIK